MTIWPVKMRPPIGVSKLRGKDQDSLRQMYGVKGETVTYLFFFLSRTFLFCLLDDDSMFSGNETVTHPSLPTSVLFNSKATDV